MSDIAAANLCTTIIITGLLMLFFLAIITAIENIIAKRVDKKRK